MKFMVIIIAASFCVFIGIVKSRTLKNRVMELHEIEIMLDKIEAFLEYEKLPTKEIVVKLSQSNSLSKLKFLKDCADSLEKSVPFPVIWRQSIEENKGEMDLTADDRKIIHMLGSMLGGSDAKTQMTSIKMLKQLTEQAVTDAQSGRTQKEKLYRSLGILSGIGITLLLV